ncbi:MAG: hypothetical protein O2807_09760, partial [bacterium]|nr:hypothetical protein [bacterium]
MKRRYFFHRTVSASWLFSALLTLGTPGVAKGAPAAAPEAEGRLTVKLPEVVIDSPDISQLISGRLRPQPPVRLGVRLPDVLAAPPARETALPARPMPGERAPDMELAGPFGALARGFGGEGAKVETAMAFLKKDDPAEALRYF